MLNATQKDVSEFFVKADSDNQDGHYVINHKYKSSYLCFATIKSDNEDGHYVYLSAYGQQASDLLDKYTENQRADNEERFAEWDKFMQEAESAIGYSKSIVFDNECVYISTFQNGVGISAEDEAGAKRYTSRGKKRKTKPISIISTDLTDGIDMDIDTEEDFDLNEEIEEADLDNDE